jgi:sulfur relay (sulfurtransferase) DsrF/TusC family protein
MNKVFIRNHQLVKYKLLNENKIAEVQPAENNKLRKSARCGKV